MYYLKDSHSDGTGGSVKSQISYLNEHMQRIEDMIKNVQNGRLIWGQNSL